MADFDWPAGPGDADQLLVSGPCRGEAQVVGQFQLALGVAGQRASHQQVTGPARRLAVAFRHGGGRPVEDAGPLGPVPAAAALPCLVRGVRGEDVGAGRPGVTPDGLVTGHGDDVAGAALLQPVPELPVPAVGLISGHPRGRDARVQGPAQHQPGELGLGGELHVIRDARLAAAAPVTGPRLRQVQLAVDQGAALARGVGAEHAQLAVLHPPGRARVLPLYPR